MNNKPQITIITPVRNGLPFIKECVESVLKQNFANWEMIISDNGSTDGTPEYLNSITDKRITVYIQKENLGIFGNLNFLFSKANADYSKILCADDYFTDETSLGKIVSYWESTPVDVGFLRSNNDEVGNCELTAFQRKAVPETLQPQNAPVAYYIFGNMPGNLSNISLRTNVIEKSGSFRLDLPYAGDFEFWERAAALYKTTTQQDRIVYVRRHAGVASNYLNQKGELIQQNFVIINGLYNEILQKYPAAKFALRLHGTLNYDTLQRYTAFRLSLKGKFNYMRVLNKEAANAQFVLPVFTRWLLFFVTLGGRKGRVASAKYLMKKTNYVY